MTVEVDYEAWDVPELFETIQLAGNISDDEMRNVFNMGIGFCLVVPKEVATHTQSLIADTPYGMMSWIIGNVIEN